MTDQNTQSGGQAGNQGAGSGQFFTPFGANPTVGPVQPTPPQPMPPVPPAPPVPPMPVMPPVPPMPAVPPMPSATPVPPVLPPFTPNIPGFPGAFPGSTPKQPPKKATSLEDLAKQTPIFADDDLDDDDFDPWAVDEDEGEEDEEIATPSKVEEPMVTTPDNEKNDLSLDDNEVDLSKDNISEAIFDQVEEEVDESPLSDFLKNLSLNKSKIFGCFAAVVGFVMVLTVLFLGARLLVGFVKDMDFEGDVQEIEEVKEVKEIEEKELVSKKNPDVKTSFSPFDAGQYLGIDSVVSTNESFPLADQGLSSQFDDSIDEYLLLLKAIKSNYELDIVLKLNQSKDRNKYYNSYLSTLKDLDDKSDRALVTLNERMVELQSVFDSTVIEKGKSEELYFQAFESFDANSAKANFENFVNYAKVSVDLRAKYRALNKVNDTLQRFSEALKIRISDIELNREPLIRGVKVFEIDGSNLDLIIRENSL